MVTKQEQLKWLAKKYKTWPEQGSLTLRLSAFEVGKFAVVNAYIITKKEWQQERDRQEELKAMTMQMCNIKPLGRDKMSSKPEVDNSWYERGELPPVGTICEMIDDRATWRECKIIAHEDGACIGWIASLNSPFYTYDKSEFRPLRTEREKAIDEMASVILDYDGYMITSATAELVARQLHYSGYRKVDDK